MAGGAMTSPWAGGQAVRPGGPRWYAVMTAANAERAAREQLTARGLAVWLPQITVAYRHRRTGRIVETARAFFGRYLFLAVGSGDSVGRAVHEANETPAVATVVHRRGEPLEIPAGVIAELIQRCGADGLVLRAAEKWARQRFDGVLGERVRLTGDNAFEGLVAEIARLDRIDTHSELGLWLEAFGARRVVQVPLRMVGEIIR